MNNSLIRPEPEKPQADKLQEHEAKLVRTIEALVQIRNSEAWSSLKIEVFDGLTARLKRELLVEAKKDDPSTNKLNRLTGELKWAEKFSDLEKFEETQRVELKGIRLRIHGKPE